MDLWSAYLIAVCLTFALGSLYPKRLAGKVF